MKKAAEAALKNAQAIIDAERAWIDIDFVLIPPETLDEETSTEYEFRVTNLGKTPAIVTERLFGRGYWDQGTTAIPLGSPGHQAETLSMKSTLRPSESMDIYTFDITRYPPGNEGQSVTYHGQVTYNDVFGQEHRTEVVYSFRGAKTKFNQPRLEYLPKYTQYVTETEGGEKAN